MDSMTFFNTLDLTHWAACGYLLSTWKQKYSLPSGDNCVVFGNSTGKIGKVVINGVNIQAVLPKRTKQTSQIQMTSNPV